MGLPAAPFPSESRTAPTPSASRRPAHEHPPQTPPTARFTGRLWAGVLVALGGALGALAVYARRSGRPRAFSALDEPEVRGEDDAGKRNAGGPLRRGVAGHQVPSGPTPTTCSMRFAGGGGGGWHGRPAKERGGGGSMKWASVRGPLCCVRPDVAAEGAGTQILARKSFFSRQPPPPPPHMCSPHDQRDVGIILSLFMLGSTPPPPGRHGR